MNGKVELWVHGWISINMENAKKKKRITLQMTREIEIPVRFAEKTSANWEAIYEYSKTHVSTSMRETVLSKVPLETLPSSINSCTYYQKVFKRERKKKEEKLKILVTAFTSPMLIVLALWDIAREMASKNNLGGILFLNPPHLGKLFFFVLGYSKESLSVARIWYNTKSSKLPN